MAKSSHVLQALKILGLEEVLKLSEVLKVKRVPLKKAAGEELVSWEEGAAARPIAREAEAEARVLAFPKKTAQEFAPLPEAGPQVSDADVGLESSELLLWQRETTRQIDEEQHKRDAISGYKKATEIYIVKSKSQDPQEKIRFAETSGVLINKKSA